MLGFVQDLTGHIERIRCDQRDDHLIQPLKISFLLSTNSNKVAAKQKVRSGPVQSGVPRVFVYSVYSIIDIHLPEGTTCSEAALKVRERASKLEI